MTTKLSVNINKLATLRNARGGNNPDILAATKHIQQFGADGITVHPRPDERHITYQDVHDIKKIITTEFNIEGNPTEKKFIDLVLATNPTQVTLVPDSIGQLTSNHGWDTKKHKHFLKEIISVFQKQQIRVSIFLNPEVEMVQHACDTGTDRIELYTEMYASTFNTDKYAAIKNYITASKEANKLQLGINAGHDLDLHNIAFFSTSIPFLQEVSIGHALICDSIYLGLENTIQMYKRCLQ